MKKRIILNAHDNTKWYAQGQQRLRESLEQYQGFEFIALDYPEGTGYEVKAYALNHVRDLHPGATVIWADCSCWAVSDPAPLFDFVERNGYFIQPSGYTVGETCNNKTLKAFGLSRKQAHKIPDCWTIVFGLDLAQERPNRVAKDFVANRDLFPDSGEARSEEPKRGTWMYQHRHDQSVMSLLLNHEKMTLHDSWTFCNYPPAEDEQVNPGTVFLMQGM